MSDRSDIDGGVDGICVHARFHTDPSGTFMRYDAKAIGSGSEAAQSELQDKWYKVATQTSWQVA